jgi:hypothetical protein
MSALEQAAAQIGVDPSWLHAIIMLESSGNPQAWNKIPYNKDRVDAGIEQPKYARGLIQFIDTSAQAIGFKDSLDLVTKLPDYDSQLMGAVVPYFAQYKPFTTKQDFYMSVFYPAFRKVPPETMFSAKVRKVNPGIDTVQSYIDHVDRMAGVKSVVAAATSKPAMGAGLLLAGAAAYFFFKG